MGKLYGGRGKYSEFDMGYDDGYYYDNNQYISDGHGYFTNDYDYVDNEYNNRGYYDNDVYFENLNDYGQGYPDDMSIYDVSSTLGNTMPIDLEYDMYASGYADSGRYAGNYMNNSSAEEFFNRHMYNSPPPMMMPNDVQFDDAYIMNGFYYEDDRLITLKDIFGLVGCVVLAFVLAVLITEYVVQHTQVDGTSMLYNFQHEDILIIDKFSYRFTKPKRYDVVIFPTKRNVYYIKRIIGLPGERVTINDDGTIYINGKLLDENYGYETMTVLPLEPEVQLKDDEYYVLGDNRNHSEDSRFENVGPVKGSKMVGKAVFRIWPLNAFGPIDHDVNAVIKKRGANAVGNN